MGDTYAKTEFRQSGIFFPEGIDAPATQVAQSDASRRSNKGRRKTPPLGAKRDCGEDRGLIRLIIAPRTIVGTAAVIALYAVVRAGAVIITVLVVLLAPALCDRAADQTCRHAHEGEPCSVRTSTIIAMAASGAEIGGSLSGRGRGSGLGGRGRVGSRRRDRGRNQNKTCESCQRKAAAGRRNHRSLIHLDLPWSRSKRHTQTRLNAQTTEMVL